MHRSYEPEAQVVSVLVDTGIVPVIPDAYAITADVLGAEPAELDEMLAAGAIKSEDVLPDFAAALLRGTSRRRLRGASVARRRVRGA